MQQQEQQEQPEPSQQPQQPGDQFVQLKGMYIDLKNNVERIDHYNSELTSENNKLYKRTSTLEAENERLKAENETFRRSLGEIAERMNRFEITVVDAVSKPSEAIKPKSSKADALALVTKPETDLPSYVAPKYKQPSITRPKRSYTPKSEQYYIRGPRGGCYYYTSSGRKEYVDRSLCN